MMTIREYAVSRSISYEAARTSVLKYQKDLEGHITISDGSRYLDDYAVELLDSHRKGKPIYVSVETSEEYKSAQQELQELKDKYSASLEDRLELHKRLDEAKTMIAQLQLQLEDKKSPEDVEAMRAGILSKVEAEMQRLRREKSSAEQAAEEMRTAKETAEAAAEAADQERERLAEEKAAADQERQRLADEREHLQAELTAVKERAAKDAAEAAETARRAERQKPWYKRLFGVD